MKNFLCLWFVLGLLHQSLCEDPVNITAEPGQNVTLTCRADRNSIVTAVRLTRDDLEPRYVFLYRNGRINVNLQNPQYLDRTELQSLYTSDGEIRLTINNVREEDSAVYQCRVQTEIRSNTRRKRVDLENTIIQLQVAPLPPQGNMDGNRGEGGNEDGGNKDGLGVSRSYDVMMVAVAAEVSVIVFMVIVTVIMRKKIRKITPWRCRETSVALTERC